MSARMRLRRADGRVFLDRFGLECRWFGVYLHRMDAPDPGLDVHSHPWRFWSWVLVGGYDEERVRCDLASKVAAQAERTGSSVRGVVVRRRRLSWRCMPLTTAHRITGLLRVPTWTLVLRGRKVREWGFFLPDGWMDQKTYDATVRTARRDMWVDRERGAS